MSNMVIPNQGKSAILDNLFRLTTTQENFVLDLFQNNQTVSDVSVPGDFTIATFTGYAQVAISRSGFSAATVVTNEGQITVTSAPTFSCTGGAAQTVYGWILRGATSGTLYAGQNFSSPRTMANGATESINPMTISDLSI